MCIISVKPAPLQTTPTSAICCASLPRTCGIGGPVGARRRESPLVRGCGCTEESGSAKGSVAGRNRRSRLAPLLVGAATVTRPQDLRVCHRRSPPKQAAAATWSGQRPPAGALAAGTAAARHRKGSVTASGLG
eukprot:scaffold148905_cov22-Tisochrysis_lutea.AAC.1